MSKVKDKDAEEAEEQTTPKEENVSEEEFRANQQALAEGQGKGPNSVPEKRPQAFMEPAPMSDLSKRILDESPDDGKPMPQSAYDAADDPKRKAKTAKEGLPQAAFPGQVLRITEGLHRGRLAAVLRVVSYASTEALLASQSRDASTVNHQAHPAEIEVSFRGDDRDGERAVLNLVDEDNPEYAAYEIVPGGFTGRGASVAGAA